MPERLLASTPLRITLLLGGAFLLAMLLAGALAWQLTSHELAARLDTAITEDFSIIAQTAAGDDETDLRDSVRSHIAAATDHSRLYLLRGADGAMLAGNITSADLPQGWSLVPGTALGLPDVTRYRVFVGPVGGDTLLVGASLEETEAVGRLVLTSLGAAALLLTLVLFGFGLVLTTRGRRRLAAITGVMHRVGQGQLGARLPVSRRADDIDAVAGQVNVALTRLDGLVEGMRQVSMDIAHDLKTPLNRLSITIASAATIAGDSELRTYLAQAETEIAQINATFEALLRIAQIEAGSRRARFQPITLAETLQPLTDLYADVAEDAGQSLTLDIAPDLPRLSGDRELLTQLFANLIENAIRHAGPGARIAVRAARSPDGIAVEVADTGPGIPAAERETVFRRLYRLDRSRSTPGSGLGLSLVRAVADLHGATIRLDDNAPGLRVIVTFPAQPPVNPA